MKDILELMMYVFLANVAVILVVSAIWLLITYLLDDGDDSGVPF